MESVLPLVTRLRNETAHSIDFSVEIGTCPFPSLKPGGRRLVNLSKVVKICRRLESDRWLIKVLIDKIITGMTLDARQFLRSVVITFKVGRTHDENFELIAEAIAEKPNDIRLRLGWGIGFVFRRNAVWNRRESATIACSLVEFPLNVHQFRARNMCCDVDVVPEAIVNVNMTRAPARTEGSQRGDVNGVPATRAPVRMEGIREGVVSVVPEAVVNMNKTREPVREEMTLHLDGYTDVLVRRKKWTSPERSPQRKTTTDDIILDGSKPDASEIRTLHSTQMETLDREGTDSDFHHHHSNQQLLLLIGLVEFDNQPHSSNALNMDRYSHMFLYMFSLLLVNFIRVLLWATY